MRFGFESSSQQLGASFDTYHQTTQMPNLTNYKYAGKATDG